MFGEVALQIEVKRKAELTTDLLCQRLLPVFEKTDVGQVETSLQGLKEGYLEMIRERQQSSGKASSEQPVRSGMLTAKDRPELNLDAAKVLQHVGATQGPFNWVLLEPTKLELHNAGFGGIEEMKEHLDVTKVLFGVIRFSFGKSEAQCGTAFVPAIVKHVFIHFVGNKVPVVRRGQWNAKQSEAEKQVKNVCITIFRKEAHDAGDFNLEDMIKELQRLSIVNNPGGDADDQEKISVQEYLTALQSEKEEYMDGNATASALAGDSDKSLPDATTAIETVRGCNGMWNWVLLGAASASAPVQPGQGIATLRSTVNAMTALGGLSQSLKKEPTQEDGGAEKAADSEAAKKAAADKAAVEKAAAEKTAADKAAADKAVADKAAADKAVADKAAADKAAAEKANADKAMADKAAADKAAADKAAADKAAADKAYKDSLLKHQAEAQRKSMTDAAAAEKAAADRKSVADIERAAVERYIAEKAAEEKAAAERAAAQNASSESSGTQKVRSSRSWDRMCMDEDIPAQAMFKTANPCPEAFLGAFECQAEPGVDQLGWFSSSMPPEEVVVVQVEEGSWADKVGLKAGDELMELQGKDVSEIEQQEFIACMHQRPLVLSFHRQDGAMQKMLARGSLPTTGRGSTPLRASTVNRLNAKESVRASTVERQNKEALGTPQRTSQVAQAFPAWEDFCGELHVRSGWAWKRRFFQLAKGHLRSWKKKEDFLKQPRPDPDLDLGLVEVAARWKVEGLKGSRFELNYHPAFQNVTEEQAQKEAKPERKSLLSRARSSSASLLGRKSSAAARSSSASSARGTGSPSSAEEPGKGKKVEKYLIAADDIASATEWARAIWHHIAYVDMLTLWPMPLEGRQGDISFYGIEHPS